MWNLVERIRFGILDASSGQKTFRYYREFIESFSLPRDSLLDLRDGKLRRLIAHAYADIPHYREAFDKLGIRPGDIRTSRDLEKIPVLTRDEIAADLNRFIDGNRSYTRTFPSSSSGTTGIPLKYVHDVDGESAGIAAGHALYHLSGWRLGKKSVHIWGNPASIKKWKRAASRIKRKIIRRTNFPAFLLNDPENYPKLLDLLNKTKPEFIGGYACSIGSFAGWLAGEGVKLRGIKTVFTTAENLSPEHREMIGKTLGPVSDLYGCGEINGVAVQPVGDNRYYILESHVIVETVERNGIREIVDPIYRAFQGKGGPVIRVETEEEYGQRLRYEIVESKKSIEAKLNKTVDFLCWPHGDNSAQAHALALEAGYKATAWGNLEPRSRDPQRIDPRIGISAVRDHRFLTLQRFVFKVKRSQNIFPYAQIHAVYQMLRYGRKINALSD